VSTKPYRTWTPRAEALLRELYPDTPTKQLARRFRRPIAYVYAKAHKLGLHKSAEYLASPHACRLRRGDNVGEAYRFPKGHVPANKGLRRPGWAPGRMAETQFKKGRPAHESRNYMPIGTEKYDVKRKVMVRKITDDPAIVSAQRWRPVHTMVWEAANGLVPAGHIVVFKRGMKTLDTAQITIDHVELVTLAENMKRNSYHTNYPKEIGLAIQARAMLTRSINKRQRNVG
jgi:hypothetical protein